MSLTQMPILSLSGYSAIPNSLFVESIATRAGLPLLHAGLLEELRLQLFPVAVGSGARLFDGYGEQLSLELADSQTFSTGVVNLVYHPTDRTQHNSEE